MTFRPDVRLAELANLFEQRNCTYGDSYLSFGKVMNALFPNGINIAGEEQWNRMALFMMVMSKVHRYAMRYSDGGHADSLDDLSVYSQMLAHVDELIAAGKDK